MPNEYLPEVSSMTLPNGGGKYYFKDAWAREQIEQLVNYSEFLGVTTSAVEETINPSTGEVVYSTVNPITIAGESDPVTAVKGNIVIKGRGEYIWDGSHWVEFGDLSALTDLLGELAYVDTATTTYTPSGTVSVDTVEFSASSTIESYTISIFEDGQRYTPSGSIGIEFNSDASAEISITLSDLIHAGSSEIGGEPKSWIRYTPTGSITLPSVEITTGSTSVVGQVLTSGSAPSLTGGLLSVSIGTGNDSENLIFTLPTISSVFDPGAMPTFSSATVINSVSNPTFSGSATFEGKEDSAYLAEWVDSQQDCVSAPVRGYAGGAFYGNTAYLEATIPSQTVTIESSFTPSATFTGSSSTITVSANNS